MNEAQPINLLNLPDEILLKIVEYLSSTYIKAVRQTCSRLYNLSNSREILKNQKFVIKCNPKLMQERLNVITKSRMNFLNLELILTTITEEGDEIDEILIKSLCSFGTKINSLIFKSIFQVNFAVIHRILISCVNLNELGFHGIDVIKWPKTSGMRPEDVNTKLETLILDECKNFTDLMVNTLLDFYPAIKTLRLFLSNISYASVVTQRFYKNFEQPSDDVLTADFLIHKITTCNKYIEKLQFSSHHNGLTKQQFQKLFILSDLRLQSINFVGQFVVSEMEFKDLVSKHDLTEFKLKRCNKFNLTCLQYLLKYCPNLQYLSLSCLPEILFMETAKVLSTMSQHLKSFEYVNNLFFTGTLPNATDFMFPNLEHLSLTLHSKEINLECLRTCCNLKYFIVNLKAGHPNKDIKPIISASQNTLVKLELRNFEYEPEESDINSKMPLNLFFPKLEVLNIAASKDLTSEIIGNFHFPSLKKLIIGGKYIVQKQDYLLMMDGCPLLEYLEFRLEKPMKKKNLLNLGYSWRFLKNFNLIVRS